jgi:hypothetical protein
LKALFCEHGQDENPRTLIGQQQRLGIVSFLKALLSENFLVVSVLSLVLVRVPLLWVSDHRGRVFFLFLFLFYFLLVCIVDVFRHLVRVDEIAICVILIYSLYKKYLYGRLAHCSEATIKHTLFSFSFAGADFQIRKQMRNFVSRSSSREVVAASVTFVSV